MTECDAAISTSVTLALRLTAAIILLLL